MSTEPTAAAMVRMHRRGASVKEIADFLRKRQSTVKRVLKEEHRRLADELDPQELLACIRRGMTVEEMAERKDVTVEAVSLVTKKLRSPELIMERINAGYSQSEVARQLGITRQAVNKLAIRGGHTPEENTTAPHIPWDVAPEYKRRKYYRLIRSHLLLKLGQTEITERDLTGLRTLYLQLLEYDLVLNYNPDSNGLIGFTRGTGFEMLRAKADEKGLLIRLSAAKRRDPDLRDLWTIPKGIRLGSTPD